METSAAGGHEGSPDALRRPGGPQRRRALASALLLVAGQTAFVVSLTLPAVTLFLAQTKDRMRPGGWTCAVNHGPTAASNWFLAAAFVVWGAAHWWRSAWAWWIGAAASVGAVLLHAFVGAWPGYEGIERLHAGYWTWLAATAAVAAAFLVLPRPVRPPAGEPLPLADRDLGRRGFAAWLGAAAAITVLGTHLLLPVPLGETIVDGPVPPGARSYYYCNGTHTDGWQPVPRKVTHADGTTAEIERHYEYEWHPMATTQFARAADGLAEFAYLALPFVFLAAATTLRAAWRWTGAALAAAVTAASLTVVECPWPTSGWTPHPLEIVWTAPACAFAAALVLLPPRRPRSA